MRINESTALVDTDFVIHIARIKRDCEKICDLLREVFLRLEVDAAVHPLVYDHEMPKTDEIINKFFDDDIIARPSFTEIFDGCDNKDAYYTYVVSELYCRFKGLYQESDYQGLDYHDVYTYWEKGESLGEIHSIALCMVFCCGMFLSDDGDSKQIEKFAREVCTGTLRVYNRKDIISIAQEQGFNLFGNREDRRAFAYTVADFDDEDF